MDKASSSLQALASQGIQRTYRKGAVLITEGDVGDSLYIILTGRLRAFSVSADDREITFGEYGPGEYVGELGLDGGQRSANVEAAERTTVSLVTRQTLEKHLSQDPRFAFELIEKLIFRVRRLTHTARDLALNDVYGRLANLLNRLAVEQSDETRLTPEPMTHEQIARQLGCSRAMITRLLNDLNRNGCLIQENHRYRLLRQLPPKW